MNESFFPLNDVSHRTLRVKKNTHFAQAWEQHLIPITVDEVADAATEFPVVLVKNTHVGGFSLVTIMALQASTNLYCNNLESFKGVYAPRVLRIYPLMLKGSSDNDQMEVCIQNDSNLLSETDGQTLFDENGEQTLFLQQQIKQLMLHSEQQPITEAFIALLLEHELLHAQKVAISLGENNHISFDGIYTIDAAKLESLDDATYLKLRKTGALQVIYAMQQSLKQINRLARLTKQAAASL